MVNDQVMGLPLHPIDQFNYISSIVLLLMVVLCLTNMAYLCSQWILVRYTKTWQERMMRLMWTLALPSMPLLSKENRVLCKLLTQSAMYSMITIWQPVVKLSMTWQ